MNSGNNESLKNQFIDYVCATSRAVLGPIPVVGSALAELVTSVIPNQRIDRVAEFAKILKNNVSEDHEKLIRLQLENENFTDLLEESLMQVVRSTTNERRMYISSIVEKGISSEKVNLIELKQLLKILGEINEIEVIWLRFHMADINECGQYTYNHDEDFRIRHIDILKYINIGGLTEPHPEIDKWALQQSYKEHLMRLGLLNRKYEVSLLSQRSSFLGSSNDFEKSNYEITPLGRLLLKHIGLSKDGFSPV